MLFEQKLQHRWRDISQPEGLLSVASACWWPCPCKCAWILLLRPWGRYWNCPTIKLFVKGPKLKFPSVFTVLYVFSCDIKSKWMFLPSWNTHSPGTSTQHQSSSWTTLGVLTSFQPKVFWELYNASIWADSSDPLNFCGIWRGLLVDCDQHLALQFVLELRFSLWLRSFKDTVTLEATPALPWLYALSTRALPVWSSVCSAACRFHPGSLSLSPPPLTPVWNTSTVPAHTVHTQSMTLHSGKMLSRCWAPWCFPCVLVGFVPKMYEVIGVGIFQHNLQLRATPVFKNNPKPWSACWGWCKKCCLTLHHWQCIALNRSDYGKVEKNTTLSRKIRNHLKTLHLYRDALRKQMLAAQCCSVVIFVLLFSCVFLVLGSNSTF